MRYRVEVSEAAKADLRAITTQLAFDNPSAALDLFHLIKNRCGALDILPDRGKAMLFNGQIVRHLFVNNYIIRYQVLELQFQILRIVDGRRDLTALWESAD